MGATTATGGDLTTAAAVACGVILLTVGVDVTAGGVVIVLGNVASGFSVTTLSHCSTKRLASMRTPRIMK